MFVPLGLGLLWEVERPRTALWRGSGWPPSPQNLRTLGEAETKSEHQKELSSLELLNTLFKNIRQEVSLGLRQEVAARAGEHGVGAGVWELVGSHVGEVLDAGGGIWAVLMRVVRESQVKALHWEERLTAHTWPGRGRRWAVAVLPGES